MSNIVRALAAGMVAVAVAAAAAVPAGAVTAATQQRTEAGKSGGSGGAVTFATYNICKLECRYGKYAWPNRRAAVGRAIAASGADIVAVQEADRGEGHLADVMKLLRPLGYDIAYARDRWAAIGHDELFDCGQGQTCGSHIFYRRSTVEPVSDESAGIVFLPDLSPGAPWGAVNKPSYLGWALLRSKASGGTVLATSMHLPNEKTGAGEQVRNAAARGAAAWAGEKIRRTGHADIPIVMMGDLNSYAPRQPNGAQKVLANAGFEDTFGARRQVNKRFSTVNITTKTQRWGGWPPSPPTFGPLGNRLDYIMAKGAGRAQLWEIQLKLQPDGDFDERWRGSDHNLVKAVVPLN